MSIQPDYSIDDLDRTDVLPLLDVAAYEASLVENSSRTDAWTVESLREIGEPAESAQQAASTSVRGASKQSIAAEALTVDVERILKRIAELEASVRAAHEANEALQSRSHAVQAERDQQGWRIRALEGENARLSEHRALTDEMMQRFERQLREQSQHADAELKELQSTRLAERSRADQEREEFERQVALMAAQDAALLETNRVLQDRLNASIAVADQRAESLAALEKSLSHEKTGAGQLARQLAAKLTDCEKLASLLQEAQQSIAAFRDECEAAQAQIRSMSEERDALLPASAQLAVRTAELEQRGVELEHALQARDELTEGLTAQLQTARDERAIMGAQLDKVRARVKFLTQHIFSRDKQIAELQADLAVHTEAFAAIRRDVNRIGESADAESVDEIERILEPIEHTGAPILLAGKTFTVGRTTENDICIPSNLVSRHHARLLVGPTGIIIEDAGSTNGCFVNGLQVRQHLMRDGDMLELGDLRYRLRTRQVHDTRVRVGAVPTLTVIARTTDRGSTVVPTLMESRLDAEARTELSEN